MEDDNSGGEYNQRSAQMDAMMLSYMNSGSSLIFILYAILVNLLAWTGIVCNFLLVYVTIREKSLRGSTNYLLALHASMEILHQTGHIPLLYIVISGQNFVTYSIAIRYVTHAIFGFTSALSAMTSIAVDRLLIVTMPLRHVHLDESWRYRATHTVSVFLPGCLLLTGIAFTAIKYPTQLVSGAINSLLVGNLSYFWLFDALNCVLEIVIYTLVWYFTKHIISGGQSGGGGGNGGKRLLKSLIWIVSVNIGCQLFGAVTILVTNNFLALNMIVLEGGNALGSVILNIGSASSLPILYIISEEYRQAVNRHLRPLKRLVLFWRPHQQESTTVSGSQNALTGVHSSHQQAKVGALSVVQMGAPTKKGGGGKQRQQNSKRLQFENHMIAVG